MREVPPELADQPDRLSWNARYREAEPAFAVHPLAARALDLPPPDGPVLDLACGPSGAALRAAAEGRRVTAVDVSEVALDLLGAEARRRGVDSLITLVQADLGRWQPPGGFALLVCTGFWYRATFDAAVGAVAPGGVLAWEGFTVEARVDRPSLPPEWCLESGEPANLLPDGFEVLEQVDAGLKRRLLARRMP